MSCEQYVHFHEQIVKIHGIRCLESLLILHIYMSNLGNFIGIIAFQNIGIVKIFFRKNKIVLCLRNFRKDYGRFINLYIKSHAFHYVFHETCGIGAIVYCKFRRITQQRGFFSQYLGKHAVKRAHDKVFGNPFSHYSGNTFTHFAGGFVGKRQRKYIPRLQPVSGEKCNLCGENTCLSRTGSGYYKRRTFNIFYGFALTFVKVVKIFSLLHQV